MNKKKDRIKQEIDYALETGAISRAIELAQEGKRLFPNDEEMQKIGRILAPPEYEVVKCEPSPMIDRCQEWIEANREEYRGKWVALRNGSLVGSGNTYQEALGDLDPGEVNLLTIVF